LLAVNGRAKEELKKILSARADNPQAVVRLITSRPGEFNLVMDVETPDDHVVYELASRLGEYTLAFEDKKFVMAKGPLSGFNKSVVTLHGEKRK